MVLPQKIFTSRIVLNTPPIGYYFCQPQLTSGRQLVSSIVVQLQSQSFYQQRNTRSCLLNEFQNTSTPSCAVPGVTVDPSQILMPVAPTVIDNSQFITPTTVNLVTPTALLEVQQTPVVAREPVPDNTNARLIAGVTVASTVVFVIIPHIVIFFIVILCQVRKNSKILVTYDSKQISITTPQTLNTHTEQVDDSQEGRFVYCNVTPEHDKHTDTRILEEEHVENPYVDESESLVCNNAQQGAESDLYLHNQRKKQSFVKFFSLELDSDKVGARAREAANTMKATITNTVVNTSRRAYQNCMPKSNNDNTTLKKANSETGSTSYDQEITGIRELGTEYTNAEILESTA